MISLATMSHEQDDIRKQLSRIVDSATFRNAQRLRGFLRFVVEETLAGRSSDIKEYSIACEVCGRSVSFDPKTDPIVRVDANRLRSRLEKYYETEGVNDVVLIGLPKGAYVPTFTHRPADNLSDERSVSLAVLPFANLGPNSEHDHIADGLTEELIHSLGRLRGLNVIARTSAFYFKNLTGDPRGAGQRLGATYVLDGAVRVANARLRVTARLIDSAQGWLLWSEKYDCAWQDVLDVQDEIAASITDALRIQLTGTSGLVPFTRVTENPDAYASYLRGRYYWHQRTPGRTGC